MTSECYNRFRIKYDARSDSVKKKKGIIVLLACFALIGISGFSYATIVTSTDTTKDVSTSSLKIELVQTSENGKATESKEGVLGFDYGEVVPETKINESMAVKVADNSKPAYVRVTVNRYWSKDGVKSVDDILDPSIIKLNSSSKDWIMVEDSHDNEIVYFYYKLPLTGGTVSSNMMDSFEMYNDVNLNSNKYSGYQSHIDFFAEGVQVMAGKDAMLAEWGVEATIGNNDEIISIVEQ